MGRNAAEKIAAQSSRKAAKANSQGRKPLVTITPKFKSPNGATVIRFATILPAMPDEILLNEAAYAVWQTVQKAGANGIELGEVAKQTGIDQAQVSAAAQDAAQKGYFKIVEHDREQIVVSDGAKELINKGLPEQLAAKKLEQVGGRLPIAEFISWAKSNSIAPNEVFKWGGARGWIDRVKSETDTYLLLTDAGKKRSNTDDDIRAIGEDRPPKPLYIGQLVGRGVDLDRVRTLLANRPELAKIKKTNP